MHVWITQNNYGHWRPIVRGEDAPPDNGGPTPRFNTREGAIAFARDRWPQLDIVTDGVTDSAAKPPPLPVIDADAEALAAGLPAIVH